METTSFRALSRGGPAAQVSDTLEKARLGLMQREKHNEVCFHQAKPVQYEALSSLLRMAFTEEKGCVSKGVLSGGKFMF